MLYEVIREVENSCKNNQLRDVFFEELEIENPDLWVHSKEPKAGEIIREDIPRGIRYHVITGNQVTRYLFTEAE